MEAGKEQIILRMVNSDLKENIYMEKDGMEKVLIKIMKWNMKLKMEMEK